jgi:cytochrome P450
MVTMIGNEEHRRRRRMLAHPYANSYIMTSKSLDDVLCRVKGHLREAMAGWAKTETSVNVYENSKRCLLDIASGWLFGSENATNTMRDPAFENALTTLAIASNQNLHMRTIFEGPMYRIASLAGGTVPLNADARDQWAGWLTRVVTNSYMRHSNKASGNQSLYDHFYDCFQAAEPDMSANDMASLMAVECDDHLSATHIGLGILLSYIMYELSRKQDWQRSLRKELLTLAEPSDESLAQRLGNLKVLDAVVTETMRTRAPCPGPFPRVVPSTGCQLVGKYNLPGGTVVSSSAWALHFNPLPFPNPDEWLPGRWLESSEATVTEMRKWIWTFGSGARVCIGTHFSMRGRFPESLSSYHLL